MKPDQFGYARSIMQVSIHHKVIGDLVTRQMHAYYVAAYCTILIKNAQSMATLI